MSETEDGAESATSQDSELRDLARGAGLVYVDDDRNGIRRRRCGRGFTYVDADGETVRDEEIRERIDELAIPPGWSDVWICERPDGHVQATGRDSEGRKQYIYHPRWSRVRQRRKLRRLEALGERLPVLRSRVGADLAVESLSRRRVTAAAVRVLDKLSMRVGNDEYVDEDGGFGLTTLRKSHVKLNGETLRFRFPGKGGRERKVELRDGTLCRLLRELRSLDGGRLFVYRENGEACALRSREVNAYVRSVTERDVTAKDFRTWAGSLHVLRFLREEGEPEDGNAHAVVLDALDRVADLLGNTRATARDFYVHPGLLEAYEAGDLGGLLDAAAARGRCLRRPGHRTDEPLLLALLPRLDGYLDEAG